MNVTEHCRDLLTYLDVRQDDEVPDATYKADVLRALNAAAQELYSLASFLSRQPSGALLPAPRTITLNGLAASGYSATASVSNLVAGSTLQIAGDTGFNQIASVSSTAITLTRPYLGSTTNPTALVYGDCAALPANVTRIIGDVRLVEGRQLHNAVNHRDLLSWTSYRTQGDYGRRFDRSPYVLTPRTGTPSAYLVRSTLSTAGYAQRIHVHPLPETTMALTFDVLTGPPLVMEKQESGNPATGTLWVDFTPSAVPDFTPGAPADVIPLPNQWDELYLLPFARKRLLASPYWSNTTVRDEILDQYKLARETLISMPPNRAPITLTPRF